MGKRNRPRKAKYQEIADQIKGKVPTKKTSVVHTRGNTTSATDDITIRPYAITWGFPVDEVMFSQFFEVHSRHSKMPWDSQIIARSTYLPDARNVIHNTFLEQSDAPYLVMLDSDVLAPPWFLDTLIGHDKPLVGGWYNHKKAENVNGQMVYQPVVYDYDTNKEGIDWWNRRDAAGVGLEKVDGIGAGCLLMRRDLAEALGENPYDMNSGGEDLVMCKKVMDAGFPIYVDWDLACPHIGVSFT